jgi:TolB-like protein
MMRFRSTFSRLAVAVVALAGIQPASAAAQDSNRPVVAVLYFDNNSIGKDRADYDGLGKGIADMLITDLAANANVRVVERERIQKLLEEQNLVTANRVDATTAVRLGRLLQAQYMIVGGFMNDGRGTMVLTARAIDVETSRITNPQRVQTKDDDVLALIAQLSSRVGSELRLPERRVGDAGAAPVQPAGAPAAQAAQAAPATAAPEVAINIQKEDPAPAAAQPAAAQPAPSKPAASQPASRPAAPRQVASSSRRMDTRTALLYAKALDEQDRGNTAGATELYRAVLTRFPDYAPARNNLARLSSR